jgi:hypothetical protein
MMRSTRRRITSALLAVTLMGLGAALPPAAHAFDRVWVIVECTGVTDAERGFWDDMPGAGTNNEAGLFWVVTNDAANERCSAASVADPGVSTTSFPELRVRMAVNDGTVVSIRLKTGMARCGGAPIIASIVTTVAEAHGGFITRTVTLPAGQTVNLLCITLSDNPDAVASERASVLIDDLRIWNPVSRAIGWRETFSRAN